MIIFPHIHKTGGTSLGTALGARVYKDYGRDHPFSLSADVVLRREAYKNAFNDSEFALNFIKAYDMVYGHFKADTYRALHPYTHLDHVCFLRDPVERTISHYYYWKYKLASGHYLEKYNGIHPELHLLQDPGFSLFDFAGLETMKHYYRLVLGECDIRSFAFIGITDYFLASILRMNELFGMDLHMEYKNINDRTMYNMDEITSQYAALKGINEENYYYYDEALVRFWNK